MNKIKNIIIHLLKKKNKKSFLQLFIIELQENNKIASKKFLMKILVFFFCTCWKNFCFCFFFLFQNIKLNPISYQNHLYKKYFKKLSDSIKYEYSYYNRYNTMFK